MGVGRLIVLRRIYTAIFLMSHDSRKIFRECKACRSNLMLAAFHIKPGGKYGRDSRCKQCVVKRRKLKRQKTRVLKSEISNYNSIIIGKNDANSLSAFSEIFATAIADMLEKDMFD